MKLNVILCIILVTLCSCAPRIMYRDTVIRDTVLKVQPPVIEKSLAADVIHDTIVQATEIRGRDTVTKVQYLPHLKKFYVRVKPDTVSVTVRDTVSVLRPAEVVYEKTPLLSKVGIGTFGFLLAIATVIALRLYLRRRL